MKHINVSVFVPHAGCPHQCSFCNHRSISGAKSQPTAQDVRDAALVAMRSSPEGIKDGEIAFFGGSFTAIDPDYRLALLKTAHAACETYGFAGIRCSTRPDAIDDERLTVLKQYGVTAIELGAQSMDGEVLLLNRRGHTAKDVENAARLIRAYGFELGLQMMTGLPGDSDAKTMKTVERLLALKPNTMRIYPTIVLENTPL